MTYYDQVMYETDSSLVGLDGERLVRVTTQLPPDIRDICGVFSSTFEASVSFPTRFLVDQNIQQWVDVPTDTETDVVHVDTVSTPSDPPADIPPLRVCTYDIEVQQGGSGPPVVSTEGTEQARNPITAISAHDSYTDQYHVWVTRHQSWTADNIESIRESVDCQVSVYTNPSDVVSNFCEWVTDRRCDVLTGWNAASFDHPYLVNWGRQHDVSAIHGLSVTGGVGPMDGDGKFINSAVDGRLLLDLMDNYEKTQIHSLDSKRLVDVADAEDVSVGKLDLEDELDVPRDEPAIDYARRTAPALFT